MVHEGQRDEMANLEHFRILKQGAQQWNLWRQANPTETPDLSEADLRGIDLREINFESAILTSIEGYGIDLYKANLQRADLQGAFLQSAHLSQADMSGADLSGASLPYTDLGMANLEGATLVDANLMNSDLSQVNFSRANLTSANLRYSKLFDANFSLATLFKTDLMATILVRVNVKGANLSECRVHGASVWKIDTDAATIQSNLIITDFPDSTIEVGSIEVAQFIHLLLYNEKIRDVIDTVTSKAVLILGRFTEERKRILNSLRDALKKNGYVPILFDFAPSPARDLTETIQLLANMSRFVIADLTDAKSIPQELSHIIPFFPSVPVQPIILASERKYALYEHWEGFKSVLPDFSYNDEKHLIENLEANVIHPAEAWGKRDDISALKNEIKKLEARLAEKEKR